VTVNYLNMRADPWNASTCIPISVSLARGGLRNPQGA